MAPVLRALTARGIACDLVLTGQHPDLDLPGANFDHPVAGHLGLRRDLFDPDPMCAHISTQTRQWLAGREYRLMAVHGDTNSCLGAARAAHSQGIAIAHVEAGLRTHRQDPWPEERNRREVDGIATLLFAPTEGAAANLAKEQVPGEIIMCGNSGIDALLDVSSEVLPRPRDHVLVTVHRRESRGQGVASVARALRRIADETSVPITVVLHPSADAQREMRACLDGIPRLTLLPPQPYREMVALMLGARLILTDSGGLQEEGPALGRPVLVVRPSTERCEAVESGSALLVGIDADTIASQTLRVLGDPTLYAAMSIPRFPFGSGAASKAIADGIAGFLARLDAARSLDRSASAA